MKEKEILREILFTLLRLEVQLSRRGAYLTEQAIFKEGMAAIDAIESAYDEKYNREEYRKRKREEAKNVK